MHEIRNDYSQEKEILRIDFKGNISYILWAVLSFKIAVLSLIFIFASRILFYGDISFIHIIVFIFSLALGIFFIFLYKKGSKQKVVVTNKKIKGTIYKKSQIPNSLRSKILYNFSMRIDQIDEIHSTGSNLHLTFVSGSNNSKEKEITLLGVKNIKEVQEKLEELMNQSKNSTDLQFEIEAKKLDLEREKIEALKNLKN